METEEREKWLLAGRIGKEIRELGISLCVPGAKILDIAEAIEKRTLDRGAKTFFSAEYIDKSDSSTLYT
jgi:hypothetical protein